MRWFYPGLGVKRWLVLAAFGCALLVNGITRWFVAEGSQIPLNETIDSAFADVGMQLGLLSYAFIIVGLLCVFWGMRQWMRAIVSAIDPAAKGMIVDALLDRRLRGGYKIVAIGGGTGLSTLLRGLKRSTSNLTAVVTVTDDGGSSGRLRNELGILPPGDIRNCLVALSDDEAMVTDLFKYRFAEGEGLTGHSFGNLFLAAMTGITGNFDRAIKESSRVLKIKGRVLPATLETVRLCAQLEDGSFVRGETNISASHRRIVRLSLEPPGARPLREVLDAIRDADAIVMGPGSLYTSVLPNVLVEGIARAVADANALKMYVCNVMTQPGETDEFTASAHVRTLLEQSGERLCDYVILNEEPPRRLLEAYAEEGQIPVDADRTAIEALGVRVIGANVISETQTVRHDSGRLADIVLKMIDEHVARRASFVRSEAVTPRPRANETVTVKSS
ncbi:MAG: YvcK family protein [Candidatus Eremiobacteraeota bacterium]|nr:YvcK family protein [Candidatus Eremiobacteraeota bacterium]MBC5820947.1 YvcK family protein [Candidatus Eremiobacteraeota bacterium]